MGRQVIGQGTNSGKLKNLLLSVVGTLAVLTCIRVAIFTSFSISHPVEKSIGLDSSLPKPPAPRSFRPITKPSSTFAPKLTRSDMSNQLLVDMNDRGDFLFLLSPPGADYKQFVHVFNGKSVTSEKLSSYSRWTLTPSGNIIKRIDPMLQIQSPRSTWGYTGWAYNDLRFFRRIADDGSFLYVNSEVKKKILTSQLRSTKDGHHDKVFYTSRFPLMLMDIDKDGALWIRESLDPKDLEKDQLLKISGNRIDKIDFPTGYGSVERVTSNGSILVATFGRVGGVQPVRTFVREGSEWKELPIPSDRIFSFVQKVFDNGLILGFITDEKREKMLQVIWNGNSVSVLNECPSWPKLGQFSFVTRATAKGDIYIRNVLNTEAGTSENYLLHVDP